MRASHGGQRNAMSREAATLCCVGVRGRSDLVRAAYRCDALLVCGLTVLKHCVLLGAAGVCGNDVRDLQPGGGAQHTAPRGTHGYALAGGHVCEGGQRRFPIILAKSPGQFEVRPPTYGEATGVLLMHCTRAVQRPEPTFMSPPNK